MPRLHRWRSALASAFQWSSAKEPRSATSPHRRRASLDSEDAMSEATLNHVEHGGSWSDLLPRPKAEVLERLLAHCEVVERRERRRRRRERVDLFSAEHLRELVAGIPADRVAILDMLQWCLDRAILTRCEAEALIALRVRDLPLPDAARELCGSDSMATRRRVRRA